MEVEIKHCLLKFIAKPQFRKTQAKYILDDSGRAKDISVQEAVFLLLD